MVPGSQGTSEPLAANASVMTGTRSRWTLAVEICDGAIGLVYTPGIARDHGYRL